AILVFSKVNPKSANLCRSIEFSSVRRQKNSSFASRSIGSCVRACECAVLWGGCFIFLFSHCKITTVVSFLGLLVTLRICLVADCGRFNCQTVEKFERAKSLAKCSKTAIRYMRCWQLGFIHYSDLQLLVLVLCLNT